MLKDIVFQSTYLKTRNEVFEDFYKPCMENAIEYKRITGYFSSSIFLVINEALKTFVNKKGQIKIICSPILSEENIDAIKNGYDKKHEEKLETYLNKVIDELQKDFPNSSYLLSNLISSGILDIKLVVFGENPATYRLMHDKAGIFIDEFNNAVAFRGSINETFSGLSQYGNSESFDVFTNWENEKDKQRANFVLEQFENMWTNTEPNVKTLEIPSLTMEKIKSFKSSNSFDELINESVSELYTYIKKPKWYAEIGTAQRKIKQYQERILNNWEKNDRCGIFEMCTGSGKTFTTLCALKKSILENNEVPIIIVPSKLLFEQWEQELKKVFLNEITILLIGAGNSSNNIKKLKRYTQKNLNTKTCVLTTYQSACKDSFLNSVVWGDHIFLICDEVHNIGSNQNLKLLEINVGPRIGLSATPERYFDDIGTEKILDFFKGVIKPIYNISDAIKDGNLCEYFYDIYEVKLSYNEQQKWDEISRSIGKKYALKNENDENIKGLEKLLFERADIIKKAEQKIYVAEEILSKEYKSSQKWLIYLDDSEQVSNLLNLLKRHKSLKNNVFEYHTNTKNDLSQTLSHFKTFGGILLSINCLDEGIDIPGIDHAIILASSKNPRQYIQRRGRVLRKSIGKNFAYIYDCLVFPNMQYSNDNRRNSITYSEIKRVIEFSKNAENDGIVMNKIKIMMNNNGMEIDNMGD